MTTALDNLMLEHREVVAVAVSSGLFLAVVLLGALLIA
ncbi:hypothetical protein LDDCCGHA_2394 [Methylobacterium oxalidis]|nr:hypothetical protein LDDCCGHA_2394 [Methylobacterium oxalidis]